MKSKLKEFNLENKTVFLRADFNVPIVNGKIFSDYKIQATRPTIDFILEKKGKIVLATHISRPKKQDSNYSTEIIFEYLKKLGYKISFEKDLDNKLILKALENFDIVLLENLRFWPEEKSGDLEFAIKLHKLAEFYVNDAFGTLHRNDSSITKLAQTYEDNKKTIGFLIEKELNNLEKLKNNPLRPLTLILGGGKVKDKLVLIESLIEKIDSVILCPALVFTVLKSQGFEVGSSLVGQCLLEYSKNLIDMLKQNKINLILPEDYLVAEKDKAGNLRNLRYKNLKEFNKLDFGISIGLESLEKFKTKIENSSKTIFFNCAMGFFDNPDTLEPLKKFLEIITESKNYIVVGGGDSVAAVQYFNLESKIDFLSTGGGATLSFLSSKNLPGLKYL